MVLNCSPVNTTFHGRDIYSRDALPNEHVVRENSKICSIQSKNVIFSKISEIQSRNISVKPYRYVCIAAINYCISINGACPFEMGICMGLSAFFVRSTYDSPHPASSFFFFLESCLKSCQYRYEIWQGSWSINLASVDTKSVYAVYSWSLFVIASLY